MTAAMSCRTSDELDVLLARMNENGTEPVVIGFDRNGVPFLAYGWAPGGDGWDTGLVVDDPHSGEFDYADVGRCDECGAFERRSIENLTYPVQVFHSTPLPTESDSYPAGFSYD